jgi:predicted secreted Zn-dependent protease
MRYSRCLHSIVNYRRPSRLLIESLVSLLLCVSAQCLYISASQPATAHAASVNMLATVHSPLPGSDCTHQAEDFVPQSIQLNSLPLDGLYTTIDPEYHYGVTGDSLSKINAQMALCSPIRENEIHYAATTYYNLSWQLQYRQFGDMCTIDTARVGLHISMVFPAWSPPIATPIDTTLGWNRFLRNLHTHENGHVARDQAAGKAIQNMFHSLPPTLCTRITALATERANRIIASLDATNQRYDSDTDHGRTQGAVLSTH